MPLSPVTSVGGGSSGGATEVGYDQVTSGAISITSTTESAGDTVIACAAHTFDGAAVIATFFCANATPGTGGSILVSLFEGATQIGRLAYYNSISGTPSTALTGLLRFTPTAGSHTYTVTAVRAVANGQLISGTGGTGGWPPVFIRFTTAA